MPDGRRRSREHWTDTMEAGPPNPPAHVHRLPKFVRLALVGLVVAQLLTLIGLGFSVAYDYQQQLYIQGRGEYRDREAARMEAENTERTRRAACDLLDTFPEGLPALERARNKYDCGPGIPRNLLTPEEQARLQPEPPVAPSGEVPPPTASQGAQPNRQAPRPEPIPPRPKAAPSAPAPAPAPEPLPELGVSVPVCEALNVCID